MAIVFAIWLAAASIVAFVIKKSFKIPPVWLGSVSVVLHFTVGLVNLLLNKSSAPRGKNKVTWKAHLLRGSIASVIIFIAVLVAKTNPTVSGLIMAFPAIMMTTIASLYLSQGEEVTTGATAPMMIASVSSDIYSIVFALTLPKLKVIATPFVSFGVSLFGISIPLALFMRYLTNRRTEQTNYVQLEQMTADPGTLSIEPVALEEEVEQV